jgi:hypothetical protein
VGYAQECSAHPMSPNKLRVLAARSAAKNLGSLPAVGAVYGGAMLVGCGCGYVGLLGCSPFVPLVLVGWAGLEWSSWSWLELEFELEFELLFLPFGVLLGSRRGLSTS